MPIGKKFGYKPTSRVKRSLGHVSKILGEPVIGNIFPVEINLITNSFFAIGGDQQPYDQGNLGSCTANALAFCFAYSALKNKFPVFMPSRLDIYYQERKHGGTITLDSGANISDCEYVLENVGLITENAWKYNDDARNKTFYMMPIDAKYDIRTKINSENMFFVNNTENELKSVLSQGYPIIFGFLGRESEFCSQSVTNTGIMKMPQISKYDLDNNDSDIFGHAVVCVGYTDDGYFLVRNSWGVNWGLGFYDQASGNHNYDSFGGKMRGYFKMPTIYMTSSLVSECYVMENIYPTENTITSSTTYSSKPSYFYTIEETIQSPVISPPNPILNPYIFSEKILFRIIKLDSLGTIELYYVRNNDNTYNWILLSRKKGTLVSSLILNNLTNVDDKNMKVKFSYRSRLYNIYIGGSSLVLLNRVKMVQVIKIRRPYYNLIL